MSVHPKILSDWFFYADESHIYSIVKWCFTASRCICLLTYNCHVILLCGYLSVFQIFIDIVTTLHWRPLSLLKKCSRKGETILNGVEPWLNFLCCVLCTFFCSSHGDQFIVDFWFWMSLRYLSSLFLIQIIQLYHCLTFKNSYYTLL